MGEHRSLIGATLLASVAVFAATAASIATSNAAGWGNSAVIGLLVAAGACFVASIVAFRTPLSGNAKMNRLIRDEFRALRRKQRLRRLLPWRRAQEVPKTTASKSAPTTAEISLAKRRLISARTMVRAIAADDHAKIPADEAEEELGALRAAGESLQADPEELRQWAADCEWWLGHRIDPAEEQNFHKRGAELPVTDERRAKLDYLKDELWPKLKAGYWAPKPESGTQPKASPDAVAGEPATEAPSQDAQRRKLAANAGDDLLGLIFQAERQASPSEEVYHVLATRVEAWKRQFGNTEPVERFSGNPKADLPRLKAVVQAQRERTRSDGEAAAQRIDALAVEAAQIRDEEVPAGDSWGSALILCQTVFEHWRLEADREVRRSASEFMDLWRQPNTNPMTLYFNTPQQAREFIDSEIAKLRHIASKLRKS